MVVDDDFDSLEIVRHILESAGYRVETFVDPMEALERMKVERPALVITDLMMKTIDAGFSFSRLINFDPRFKGVPIILITAAAKKRGFALQAQNVKDLQKMGIDGYFDKPVDPDQLLRKVRELLAREPTLP
jgi:chemosensory pili system protein ChpA (sensor histidine kinase/response regulator)